MDLINLFVYGDDNLGMFPTLYGGIQAILLYLPSHQKVFYHILYEYQPLFHACVDY